MPGFAVQNCRNYSKKTGSVVTYHRFPNDLVTRKNWIFACKRKDLFKADTSRVCSNYFSKNNYERDLQSELPGIKRKRTLRTDVVPHLLPNNCRKGRRPENPNMKKTKVMGLMLEYIFLENEIQLSRMRVSSLEEEIKQKNTSEKNTGIDQYKNPAQAVPKICKHKTKGNFERHDDIAAALTLRSISRKAYLYLQKNVGVLLPGLSTIQKWTRNLKCLPHIKR
ncbi:hypothetical protein PR048_005313 [Dryococelus australis]|uniref:THAP-type domain-containing protein n=1 Tax=Dryococelus australis TaxID=614101 RepID=A0ABQ9I8D1_9NEOP|nr:hypothetical protein PR048_005313 [Dryococelus australis]